MRIGIDARYVRDYFPGIGRYTFQLVRALGEVDADNEYVVYADPGQVNTRYRLDDLTTRRVRLADLHVGVFSAAAQWAIPLRLRRDRIDLFHSPYYVKPYRLPCPSVATVHDAIGSRYPGSLPSWRARVAYELAMRLTLATANAVIVPSKAARDDLRRYFGYPPDRTTVVYEAADDFLRPPLGEPPDAVAGVLAPAGGRYVLFVGANKPHKNLVGLLEALAAASGDLHLAVAGRWDPRFPEPAERARSLGLADRVHFLGEVDEVTLRWFLARALALVQPSLSEGFGLPVLEAMAAGTPVICADRGSLPEVAGEAALLVDPEQQAELAAALSRIATEPGLRQDLAARGRRRAERFSWKRAALATISVYQSVRRSQP